MTTPEPSTPFASKPKIKRGPYIITKNIIDFLNASDEPRHLTEIHAYINDIIPVTQRNIGSILYATSDKFVLFNGRFYGLKEKVYKPETLKFTVFNRLHFRRDTYAMFNGWDLEKVIQYYVDTYGYRPAQARFYLNKSIRRGVLKLQDDNTLSI
jgi:hypothetical protein